MEGEQSWARDSGSWAWVGLSNWEPSSVGLGLSFESLTIFFRKKIMIYNLVAHWATWAKSSGCVTLDSKPRSVGALLRAVRKSQRFIEPLGFFWALKREPLGEQKDSWGERENFLFLINIKKTYLTHFINRGYF